MALDLCPIIETSEFMSFIGLYAKNREEWVITSIAAMKTSVVVVTYYDTLGPDSVDFITNQTDLITIACSNEKVEGLS
jgi:long-chain acyl-CoA synthetase